MREAAARGLTRQLSELATRLRAADVPVGTAEVLQACRALSIVAPLSRREAFVAIRAVYCKTPAERERFAAAFDAVFDDGIASSSTVALEARAATCRPPSDRSGIRITHRPGADMGAEHLGVPDAVGAGDRAGTDAEHLVPAAYSPLELLAARDVSELDDADRRAVETLVARLGLRAPTRVGRRARSAHRRARLDGRGTFRASVARGGEPIELRWRTPPRVPRRLVFLCDVSGSMAPYAKLMLLYAQAWTRTTAAVEAFTLGTRVTRVTHDLASRDQGVALGAIQRRVLDWGGGTRLGAAIAVLNREHADRVGRGAVVVVLSDGWERGDPSELRVELARLRRCAQKLLWVTPLAGDPRFEPLTRGMLAALPSSDRIMAGHSLGALYALTEELTQSSRAYTAGRERTRTLRPLCGLHTTAAMASARLI